MPHPDNVDVLWMGAGETALERIQACTTEHDTDESFGRAVLAVVHEAQRYQRRVTAKKIRRLVTGLVGRADQAALQELLDFSERLED